MAAVSAAPVPERREPSIAMAKLRAAADGKVDAGAEVKNLQARAAQLQETLHIEGIDPNGPLGVWSRALRSALNGLAVLVEVQADRIEDKAEGVERAMLAEVARVKAAVEEARALTNRLKLEIEDNQERRKEENLALAKELGEGIKDTLKTALLIRERRWNRRQNWSTAMLAASVLVGCFIAGAGWNGYQRPVGAVQEVMDRCVARKVLDEVTHQYFCPVKVVLGQG
jgi:hypothetical protein